MLKIEDGIIYLTRGDDAVLQMDIAAADGAVYPMQAGDTLTLTVRELPDGEAAALFLSDSVPGSSRIVIRSADTAGIEPGRYSADIQLNTADGRRHTVWPELEGSRRYTVRNLKNFAIMPEVTTR